MQTTFLVELSRWILPLIAFNVIIGCGISLVRGNRKTGTIGYLINAANADEIPLTSCETSIGRSNACDIVLNYTTVSRFHAVIAYRGGRWLLFDTNSKTGTMINEERIVGKGILEEGDVIVFGNAIFKFFEHKPSEVLEEEIEEELEDNMATPLFAGDEKFYTGEIFIPGINNNAKYSVQNCITGEVLNIDNMDNVLLGRSEEAQIHISSPSVSRNHALLSRSGNGFIIEDLDSLAGTLLNGVPVKECTPLKDGDIIEICGFTLKFREVQ